MPRETIILDLLTGNGEGLRIAKFPHSWNGQAFAAPKAELKILLAKPELDSPGIYILHGEIELNEPIAYIGVGKSIRNRLGNRKEKFWNQVIVFVGGGGSLHEGNIKFLEGRLIDEARKCGRFNVINDQPSGSPLPDHESAAMEGLLDKIRILLPILGCHLLIPKSIATQKRPLTCRIKGLVALGNRTQNGFIVFKNSEAVLEPRRYAKEHRNWVFLERQRLIKLGVLVAKSDRLRFSKDYEFSSSSAAAAVVRGGNASGPLEWRAEDGRTLKELDTTI
jgi:hypothetical protein